MARPKLVSSGSLKLVWAILAHNGEGTSRYHEKTYNEAVALGWLYRVSLAHFQADPSLTPGWNVTADGARAAREAANLNGWK